MLKHTIALLVILATLFAIGCQKKIVSGDVSASPEPKQTAVATEAATEVPTEAPTSEPTPTATPEPTLLPDDWETDPFGIIPTSVHIYAQDEHYPIAHCITTDESGNAVLQTWRGSGLAEEIPVSNEFLEVMHIEVIENSSDDRFILLGLLESNFQQNILLYYLDRTQQKSFSMYCNSFYWGNTFFAWGAEGKFIYYTLWDDFYEFKDFGSGSEVVVDDNFQIYIDSEWISWNTLKPELEKLYF